MTVAELRALLEEVPGTYKVKMEYGGELYSVQLDDDNQWLWLKEEALSFLQDDGR